MIDYCQLYQELDPEARAWLDKHANTLPGAEVEKYIMLFWSMERFVKLPTRKKYRVLHFLRLRAKGNRARLVALGGTKA